MSERKEEAVTEEPEAIEAEKQPVEEKESAADEKEGAILSHKRRTALVAYLSILFAVAFLLVAVSMIIENQRLQDSNSQNTATLNGKIADLQDEYNQLMKKSKEQEGELSTLQTSLEEANRTAESQTAEILELTGKRDELTAEKEGLTAELETLTAEFEELTAQHTELSEQNDSLKADKQELEQKADDLEKVYDLLIRAKAADESGDYAALEELLEQIEPLKDLLSDDATELYESLIID